MKTAVLLGICLLTYQSAPCEKNFSTQFQVLFADRVPGDFGRVGSCSMRLRAENRIYTVSNQDTYHPCVVFAPGTVLRGSENHTISASVDLLDESGSKPKAHRYWVRDIELRAR